MKLGQAIAFPVNVPVRWRARHSRTNHVMPGGLHLPAQLLAAARSVLSTFGIRLAWSRIGDLCAISSCRGSAESDSQERRKVFGDPNSLLEGMGEILGLLERCKVGKATGAVGSLLASFVNHPKKTSS